MSKPLALYYSPTCAYCQRVLAVARRLDIPLELRDARADPQRAAELFEAMGRNTVPVLRYVDESGEDRWMPESGDITRFLQERSGVTPRWPRWLEALAGQSLLAGGLLTFLGLAASEEHAAYAVIAGGLVAVAGQIVLATS